MAASALLWLPLLALAAVVLLPSTVCSETREIRLEQGVIAAQTSAGVVSVKGWSTLSGPRRDLSREHPFL